MKIKNTKRIAMLIIICLFALYPFSARTQVHYTFTSQTGGSYSILIQSILMGGNPPAVGNEIGVFDITSTGDTLCVGATVYNDTLPLPLVAWEDNSVSPEQDGYTSGNPMIFKLWDSATGNEYVLEAIFPDGNGTFESGALEMISSLTSPHSTSTLVPDEGRGGIVESFKLLENYPNPFNPQTMIKFQIPAASYVNLDVFDAAGRLVKNLVSEKLGMGVYSAEWDGTNNSGITVSSGMYIYILRANNFRASGKMVLLK